MISMRLGRYLLMDIPLRKNVVIFFFQQLLDPTLYPFIMDKKRNFLNKYTFSFVLILYLFNLRSNINQSTLFLPNILKANHCKWRKI